MSAWIVEKGHIDVLANAAVQYGLIEGTEAAVRECGAMLWEENRRSVDYRYREENERTPYVPNVTEAPLDPRGVYYAVRCYDYQSCEHPAWETSEAHALCERIEAATGVTEAGAPAYGEFPWGFDALEQAIAVRVEG